MTPVVECCVNNLSADGRKALEESTNDVRFSFCLDRCGRCHEEQFLVVDGTPVSGTSYAEIIAAVDETGEGRTE